MDRRGQLAGTTGAATRVYYNDGGTFYELQGIGQMEIGVGQAQSNTYPAFEGSFSNVGAEEIGQVTFEIASYQPNHPSWKWMEAQRAAGNDVQLRAETPEQVIFTASKKAMIAIASETGAVTFSGTESGSKAEDLDTVARGHVFKIGSNLYTIRSISDDATPKFVCEAPAANVVAATYSVLQPILQWRITGGIATSGGATLAQDAAVTSQLIIQPRSRVPLAQMVTEHTIA